MNNKKKPTFKYFKYDKQWCIFLKEWQSYYSEMDLLNWINTIPASKLANDMLPFYKKLIIFKSLKEKNEFRAIKNKDNLP